MKTTTHHAVRRLAGALGLLCLVPLLRADLVFDANFERGVNLSPTAANPANTNGSLVGSATIGVSNGYNFGNALIVTGATASPFSYAKYNYTPSQLGFSTNNGWGHNTVIGVLKLSNTLTSTRQTFFSMGDNGGGSERVLLNVYQPTAGQDAVNINTVSMGNQDSYYSGGLTSIGKLSTSTWYFVGVSWDDQSSAAGQPTNTFKLSYYLRALPATFGQATTTYFAGNRNPTGIPGGTGNVTVAVLNTPVDIGARSDSPGSLPFNGLIDQVRGYNTTFTQADFDTVFALIAIPEPGTWVLLLAGAMVGYVARRGKQPAH